MTYPTIFVVAGVAHYSLADAQDDRAGLLDEGYNVEIERFEDYSDLSDIVDEQVQFQADIDANYSTTVWSPCVTAIGTDHDGVEFD